MAENDDVALPQRLRAAGRLLRGLSRRRFLGSAVRHINGDGRGRCASSVRLKTTVRYAAHYPDVSDV